MSRFKYVKDLLVGFVTNAKHIIPSAIITGLLVALFLRLLDYVTTIRFANAWLVYGLPLGGVIIVLIYHRAGSILHRGNNLVIDEINSQPVEVPARIAPVIMLSTLITHLFGGSAGREGTAVQMGGGVASYFATIFKVKPGSRKLMLTCGMAAGFGAVFGTPFAGAIFAIEVLRVGKFRYHSIIYCVIASFIGDLTCSFTGVTHTTYNVNFVPAPGGVARWMSSDVWLFIKVMLAGCIFGCTAQLYVRFSDLLKDKLAILIPGKSLQIVVGAGLVIGLTLLLGSNDYLGLGVISPQAGGVSIQSSFSPGGAGYLSWFWKMLLTVITLSFGFKGGEVTPLFFIGATLGNVIAMITGAPVDLFAAIGFIGVFAGATNTPLACTIMGMELFGSDNFIFFGVACLAAFLCSGKRGIYSAQQAQ